MDTVTSSQIYDLLCACDNDFIPSLSSRIDIKSYSHRILAGAVNFEAWNKKNLIGLVSMYANKDFGYITNVCVLNKYSGKGIASKLIENCFDYAIKNKIYNIELETNEGNVPAMKLYTKFGFKFSKKW